MSDLQDKLKILPNLPGCYLMKNKFDKIIYVGKAKNLKNRVKSYFVGSHNLKTTKLVMEIADFDFVITKNETESLVLELNLIKEHDPKYNILLKDDKTYPYIVLTNERHPRLLVLRKFNKKNIGTVFGPYPNVSSARKTFELLNILYPLRKCQVIPKKECLYFHMHQCLAPCINKGDFDYKDYKENIISFLNGDPKSVLRELENKMLKASMNLEFEKAIEYRNLMEDIKITTAKQIISGNDLASKDVIGIYHDEEEVSVHILFVRNGDIINNYQNIFSYVSNYNEAINSFLLQFYSNKEIIPKEIVTDFFVEEDVVHILNTNVINPQKGRKKELLNMANVNAKKDLDNKTILHENKVLKKIETIENLGKLLDINPPYHIEAFDNSNLFGEYPISAMVVYKDGRPSKKDYRKFHIKSVVGANDYQTMKEVIYRRYFKLLMQDEKMPDLIVMDGGEIQVNAAIEVIKSLNLNLNVCGIKKDDNHKANILVFEGKEYILSKNSDIYLLLANISQTVHDFAITFFRSSKNKGMFSSRLDGIKNLGSKRKEKLLKHFMSIDNIKKANLEDFTNIGINEKLAIEILKNLNEELE